MKTSVLRLAAVSLMFVFAARAYAAGQEKTPFDERMIGSSVKLMAKTYVLTADIEKLKRKHIAQIREMDDESFYAQYANTLGVVDECPEVRKAFGFTGEIDRAQAMEKIAGLDKKRLYAMIDSVPDAVIAKRFKRFMGKRMEEMKGMDPAKRIQYAWNSLVGRIEK